MTKPIRVLGLDLSTKAGVAVVEMGRKVLFTEEVEFKKLTGWPRVCEIASRIVEVRDEYRPDLIVIEELFIGHASSAIVLAQINSIVRYMLWQEEHTYRDVSATHLKKWLTGKGNAQKDTMMMEVFKQFGYESKTNNIADAVALGMFGLCTLGDKFTAAQRQATVVPEKKSRKKAE